MAAKKNNVLFSSDELTNQLLFALQQHTDRNKSDLIRSAVYHFAKYEFGDEKFAQVLLDAIDTSELLK